MPFPLLAMLAAGAIGKVAGGAAKGSADQRHTENSEVAERNRLLAQLYGTRQNATSNALANTSREQSDHAGIDLDRRRFALTAPSARASQSVRGSLMQNLQPFSVSGLPPEIQSRIPQMSGGLTPAAFNADTRALGGELTRKALIDQLRGDEFDPLEKTDFQGGVLDAPTMEAYQRAGLLEKIMGGVGVVGSLAGGVGEAYGMAKGMPGFGARNFGARGGGRVLEEDV
jgi:hypothetical protein